MHVYVITCRTNGKIYVGQHKGENLQRYLTANIYQAIHNKKFKPVLYAAIRKHGGEAFTIRSLARPVNREQMNELERFYIRTLDSQNKEIGYNILDGGVGSQGIKRTEEHKRKISQALKGRKVSDETKQKMSEIAKNRSPEVRENMSKAQLGKKISANHATALRSGFLNMSDESRQRMETGYLKVDYTERTDEHCRKISEALTGRKASESTKKKLSDMRRGRTLSPEHCKSISEAFMKRMTREERSQFAKHANEVRWGKPTSS